MLLRDVSINALALEKEEAFMPSCDEIDALEALHDAIDLGSTGCFCLTITILQPKKIGCAYSGKFLQLR